MTIGQWGVLSAVLGLSFIGFIVVVSFGYINNRDLNKGEMRRAISAFFILLFGLLVSASFLPTGISLPGEIQGLFAGTITTLIGFYFGSRAASS